MFEGFSFEPSHRPRADQVFYDPLATTGSDSGEFDGSVSPTDSSRGSTPPFYDFQHPGCYGPTSIPPSHSKRARQTSITELSQYFTRQTLQPGRQPSTPSAMTSVPLLLRSHDPTNLAVLNATHARRISRRRPSSQAHGRAPCSAYHRERVASLVDQILDENGACPTSTPRSCGSSISISRRASTRLHAPDLLDNPDNDDVHPSMMIEEGCDDPDSEDASLSSLSSPLDGPSGYSGGVGGSFFDFSGPTATPTPPLPGDVTSSSSTIRRGSTVAGAGGDKVMKPVRLRRRGLGGTAAAVGRSRLSIGTK